MKRIVVALSAALIALSTTLACAVEKPAQEEPQYSAAQIRKMAREAHTAEQFSVLADYYAIRQRMFKQKAAEAMHLWAMRSASIAPLSEKWPRPVDSARNLHDYYEYEANKSAALQAKYSHLADVALNQASQQKPQ